MVPLIFNLGPTELLIILAILLLLFGGARLAGLGKSTGRALREFKEETKNLKSKDDDEPQPLDNGQTSAPQQPSQQQQPYAPQQPIQQQQQQPYSPQQPPQPYVPQQPYVQQQPPAGDWQQPPTGNVQDPTTEVRRDS